MIVGILEADPALEQLRDRFGNYVSMFKNLLDEGSEGSALEYKVIVLLRSEKVESVEIAEMIKKYRADSVDGSGKAMLHLKLELDKLHISPGCIYEVRSILAVS